MTVLIVLGCIICLIVLISVLKINPFLAFLVVSLAGGLFLKIPAAKVVASVEKGIGDTLGSLVIIIVLGAMLGKLVAETGAAQKIASVLVKVFGVKHIQWAMVVTGFIIGIPLFYGIGFVLMVPLIFSIVYQYKLPAVYVGLPMLAALSVTHGFLPPHPSPSALVVQFQADMGLTLVYGISIAIPAIILAGPLFSRLLKGMKSEPSSIFVPVPIAGEALPSTRNSLITALLPVALLAGGTLLPYAFPANNPAPDALKLISNPSVVMIITLIIATFSLGLRNGRSMDQIMEIYVESVKDVGMIVLIISGSGALKQVLTDSGASDQIGAMMQHADLPPLVLGWLIAAIIRASVGSATVAGLTTGGLIAPSMLQTHCNPNLMVLSIGAGSLMFSHVNDSGFWMFKEYFNLSVKDTLRSWSVMESIVSVAGLAGVLILTLFIQ